MNLRLLQLSDSALPIGGYTHSFGLEAAIARRLVHDAETLESWAANWIRHAAGPLEGVVVASACRHWRSGDGAAIARADDVLTASLAPPSIRAASHEMGEQLLSLGSTWIWSVSAVGRFQRMSWVGLGRRKCNHAVVFGVLGAIAGGSPHETLLAYFHQIVMGIIGAGIRALPVGHTQGQQILAYLHESLVQLAAELEGRPLESTGSGCPFYEVLCDEQTRLYSRQFRS